MLETSQAITRRLPDGTNWWIASAQPGDYETHKYNIALEPLLREIRHGGETVGYVTRNRYEAEVLNTPSMMILDFDKKDDHGRCPSSRLYAQILRALDYRRDFPDSDKLFFEIIREDLQSLRDLDFLDDSSWTAARYLNAQTLEALKHAYAGLGFRLYRTRNGFRAICTTHAFDLQLHDDGKAPFVWDLMHQVCVDDAYRRICFDQGLFRARLTPKPWRLQWEGAAGRACDFWGTIGSTTIRPEFQAMIAEHDQVTEAHAVGSEDGDGPAPLA